MTIGFSNRALLIASVTAAVLYLVVGGVLLKGITVSALAVIAFRSRQWLLGAALLFGSAGDVLLDLDPKRLFVFGLGAFLLGHITYTVMFLRRRKPAPWTPVRIGIAAALLTFVATFSAWLSPSLGALAGPVYFYMAAITVMALSAVAAGFQRPWAVIGAILFVASDSMLGAAKFIGPFPARDILVWTTYCLAQYGITFGCLAEPD